MENLNLEQLVKLRTKMILEGKDIKNINYLIESKEEEYSTYITEDVSGTGGPSGAVTSSATGVGGGGVAYSNANIGGMGAVVSPQPSSFAGVTTEPGYSAGGGKSGSGDIGVPYNAGGKKVFQKVSSDNRRGSNRRRKNKVLAGLKQALGKKLDFTYGEGGSPKGGKIMSFDNFKKDNLSKVTKVSQ